MTTQDSEKPLLPESAASTPSLTRSAVSSCYDLSPLTGLRGVCAALIVSGHFFTSFCPPLPTKDRYPVVALPYLQPVTTFFILSGMALALFYADGLGTSTARKAFWWKRLARIAPVYYVALALSLPSFIKYWPGMLEGIGAIVLAPVFLQSFFLIGNSWCGPLWQISAFMLSYLTFPWLVSRLNSYSNARLLAIAAACWLLPLSMMSGFVAAKLPAGVVHTWFLPRYPHFVIGVIVGLVMRRAAFAASAKAATGSVLDTAAVRPHLPSFLRSQSAAIAVVELCTLWFVGTDTAAAVIGRSNVGRTWLFLNVSEFLFVPLQCVWIMGMTVSSGGPTRAALAAKPVRALGDMSYPVYCLHYPVLYLYSWLSAGWGVKQVKADRGFHMGSDDSVEGLFALHPYQLLSVLATSIVLAVVVHQWVEVPCRSRSSKQSKQSM